MTTRQEIEQFFETYAAAFNRLDIPAVTALWAFPAFITQDGRALTFDDPARFESNTKVLCDFYARQGMARVAVTVTDIQVLYPTAALARPRYALFDADEAPIVRWETVYLLRRSEGGWKAVMAVADGEVAAWTARGTPLGES